MEESEPRSPSPVEENTISELKQIETPVNIIPSSQVLLSTTNYVLVRDDGKLLQKDLSSPNNSISIQEQSDEQSTVGGENVSFSELISSYCSNDDDNEVEALITLLNEWKIPKFVHQFFIGKYRILI